MIGPPGSADFFYTGGELRDGAPSYIEREADRELLHFTTEGELCYVLAASQMGKTSLINRARGQLLSRGIASALVDLQQLGTSSGEDQWLVSFLEEIRSQLSLPTFPDAWWDEYILLTPITRFIRYLEEQLNLGGYDRVVIFVDELGVINRLSFGDDVISAIRSLHSSSETRRVSFALFGSTSPEALMRDTASSTQGGQRLRLQDLELRDILGWSKALPNAGLEVLERIFYWTNGHPYLTQRIAQLARADGISSPEGVDELVKDGFLGEQGKDDSNLSGVRTRIENSPNVVELARLYRSLLRGKRIRADRRSALHEELLLSGLVQLDKNGALKVHNRIYRSVFDAKWATSLLPTGWWAPLPVSVRASIAMLGVLTAVLLVVSLNAIRLSRVADDRMQLAISRQLITQSLSLQPRRYDLELLLLLEALNRTDSPETLGYVRYALASNPFLGAFMQGHESDVASVAISQDGQVIASGDVAGTVAFWDSQGGELVRMLRAHSSEILDVGISSPGVTVTMGCADTVSMGECSRVELARWRLGGHDPSVRRRVLTGAPLPFFSMSKDGAYLLTGSEDSLTLWDTGRLKPVWTGQVGTDSSVTAFIVDSMNRGRAFVGNRRGQVGVVELQQEGAVLWIDVIDQTITQLALSPDGTRLALGLIDGSVFILGTNDWRIRNRLLGHTGRIAEMAFVNNELLLTAAMDARLLRWDLGMDDVRPQLLSGAGTYVSSLAVAADETAAGVFSNGPDGLLIDWRLEGEPNRGSRMDKHKARVISIAFDPTAERTISVGVDQTVRTWGFRNSSVEAIDLRLPLLTVNSAAYEPQTATLALAGGYDDGSGAGVVVLLRLIASDDEPILLTGLHSQIRDVAFSPDGMVLATSDESGQIRLWDVASTEPLGQPIQGHTTAALEVEFSPSGNLLVSGGSDGSITFWDATTLRSIGVSVDSDLPDVLDLAFSPDGATLAAVGSSSTVSLIDTTSFSVRDRLLTNELGQVNAVAFSSDGSLLATAGTGGTISIWNVKEMIPVGLPMQAHRSAVWDLGFSPDGRFLASAGELGDVLLSVIDYEDPRRAICDIVGRDLTQDEWRQYIGSTDDYRSTCGGPEAP